MHSVRLVHNEPHIVQQPAASARSPLPANVRGPIAMVVATFVIMLNDAVAKHLSESYPIGQILCLRHAAALVMILAYARWAGVLGDLRVVNHWGQAVRGALFVVNTATIVLALSLLPIAINTPILFSSPMIVAALSWPLLGERVGLRRWIAIVLGFMGVLVIIRPGGASFEWALLLPAFAAFSSAVRDICTRWLARTETSLSILFWSNAMLIVAAAATLPFGWQPVTWVAAGWFVFNGLLNASAHFLMIHALRLGDASLVVPFRYTGIVWAICLGWLMWGHLPDGWALAGSVIITASGIMAIEGRMPRIGRARPGVLPALAWALGSGALVWLLAPTSGPLGWLAAAAIASSGAIAILAAAGRR